MKSKFNQGDSALFGEETVTIKATQKNFLTKKVKYSLSNGAIVEESDPRLKKIANNHKKSAEDKVRDEVREQYRLVLKKEVAPAKKNNVEWMKTKIQEELDNLQSKGLVTPEAANVPEEDTNKPAVLDYQKLLNMEDEELKAVIENAEIDVDIADYDNREDLLVAVCDELEIERPVDE